MNKYAISDNEENYYHTLPTREAAIKEGKALYEGAPFYVGECVKPKQPEEFWNAEDWIERVNEQDDYCLECAEDWASDITKAQYEELEAEVRKVMAAWLDRHNIRPTHFLVVNTERVDPEASVS